MNTEIPTDALRLVPVETLRRCAAVLADPKAEHSHDVSYLIEQVEALAAASDMMCCDNCGTIRGKSDECDCSRHDGTPPVWVSAAPASPLPEGGGQCSGITGELSGWQNISTAPRDGSEFQAWWKGTWQPRARFDPEYGSFQLWGRTDFDTEGWEVFEIDGYWQPQPAAPTGDAK